MATSGSWDFSLTAAQLIQAAYEDMGAIQPGIAVATAQSDLGLSRLNMIAKQEQGSINAPGLRIWTRQRITMLMAAGQQTYTIGPAATDSRASLQMGRTTVSTAYVSGTSLAVMAVTDTTSYPGTTISMTSADFIGVELDNGTIAYTTLNGTPGSSPVTLTAGFSSAAAAGRRVWWFTARAQRFPAIEAAVLRDANMKDVQLGIFRTVEQYDAWVADKYADSDPTTILVEPLRLNTRITLDAQPVATTIQKMLVLTVLYPAEDYDATTNDIAFPQEYFLFLKWRLMRELSHLGKPWTAEMIASYNETMSFAKQLNPEVSNAYFQPGASG